MRMSDGQVSVAGSQSTAGSGGLAVNAATPNLLVIDVGWKVVVASETDIWEAAGIPVKIGHAVPGALQALVSAAVGADKIRGSAAFCVRISPWPGVAITIFAVESASQRLVAINAQQFRARQSLRHAQRTYGLSPRELEILSHVLNGAGTAQIAMALNIADSTVIAHIKSLLMKTKATNRAALVARVLGWEGALAT